MVVAALAAVVVGVVAVVVAALAAVVDGVVAVVVAALAAVVEVVASAAAMSIMLNIFMFRKNVCEDTKYLPETAQKQGV